MNRDRVKRSGLLSLPSGEDFILQAGLRDFHALTLLVVIEELRARREVVRPR